MIARIAAHPWPAIAAAAAILWILFVAAVRALVPGGPEAPRRGSCSRAGDARRHALAAACRRAPAWARHATALRLHGITITPGADREPPAEAPALAPANRRDDGEGKGRAFHGLNHADTEPTRKATGAERHAAETAVTRPWADDTGAFTRFVEDGDRHAPPGGAA